jgi:ABC-2 type transport system permease protein
MNVAPYWAHFRTTAIEDFRYFISDSLMGGVAYCGFIVLALLLYDAMGTSIIAGFTWGMLTWYIISTELLIANQSGFVRNVSAQVQSGEIVQMMTKPYHYPLAMLAKHLASVMVESIAILTMAIPLGIIIAGTESLSLFGIIFGIMAMVLAFLIDFAISLSIGLIAFWTEDATPYQWIYSKILFILGGLLFPLDIFPIWLQTIAKLLPAAYLIYYPARLIVDFSWELLFRVLVGQVFYLALFGVVAFAVYRIAIKKVSINGG